MWFFLQISREAERQPWKLTLSNQKMESREYVTIYLGVARKSGEHGVVKTY